MGTFVTTSAEIEGFTYYDLDDPPDWFVEKPADADLFIRPVTSGTTGMEILDGTYYVPFSTDFAFGMTSISVDGSNSGHLWTFALHDATQNLELGDKVMDLGAFIKTNSGVHTFTLPETVFVNQGYFYITVTIPSGARSDCAQKLAHSRLDVSGEVPRYPLGRARRFVEGGGSGSSRYCPFILLGVE